MSTVKHTLLFSAILAAVTVPLAHAADEEISAGEVVLDRASLDNSSIQSILDSGKRVTTMGLDEYAKRVNESVWSVDMRQNNAMTVKLQALLDWNHASAGPIDGGWGMNSKKALTNFQKMKGLEATGRMNQETWDALIAGVDANQPVLVSYTITEADAKGPYNKLPSDAEARSKLKALGYESIVEMLGERFHMDVAYVRKLNPNAKFKAGETITVVNTGKSLDTKVTRVVADRKAKILYAYNGDKLVATYPTTVGGDQTSTPGGKFKVVNKVKMPITQMAIRSIADPCCCCR